MGRNIYFASQKPNTFLLFTNLIYPYNYQDHSEEKRILMNIELEFDVGQFN